MNLKIKIAVVAVLALPVQAFAEQPAASDQQSDSEQQTALEQQPAEEFEPSSVEYASDREALPTLIVEGTATRPGTFGTVPDSTGLKDTASLLQRVPGANVNRNGPLTGIAQYRGMYGNRVNVNIDNANFKEVGPNSMDPPLSHIPAPLTESLQVFRGIAPVSSGIETIGGSIIAKPRRGDFYGNGFKLTDGLETNGLITGGYSSVDDGWYTAGLATLATENHKLFASGIHQEGRDYFFRGDKKVRPSQYDRDIWNVGYGYQRDGHEFGINYSNNDTGHTGTPALPMDIIYVRGGLSNMDYKWDLDNGHELKANIYYQNMRHEMNNFTLRDAPTMVMQTPMPVMGMDGMAMMPMRMLRQMNTDVRAGGLDLGYTLQLFSGDFTFGFNGDQADHDAKVTDPTNPAFFIDAFDNVERDRYSFYGEWEGDIAQDFSMELGARFINANTNAGTVNYNGLPAMATGAADKLRDDFNNADRNQTDNDVDLVSILRYQMNSTMDWEIGFGRKNRSPSYQERYIWLPLETTGGLADGRNYIGTIDLDHETAYQAELGFNWNTNSVYFSPRAFYHYVDDYIQGIPTDNMTAQMLSNGMRAMVGAPPTRVLQFSNINAQLYGVDFDAGYRINDNWRLDGGLNYVRGERVGSVSDNLYRIAPLNGRAQLTFEHSGWMAAVEGVFYGSQNKVSSYNDEKPTPGYSIMNVRTSYQPVEGVLIALGLENAFDRESLNHLGGTNRVLGNPDLPPGSQIPLHGRNVYTTLSLSW